MGNTLGKKKDIRTVSCRFCKHSWTVDVTGETGGLQFKCPECGKQKAAAVVMMNKIGK